MTTLLYLVRASESPLQRAANLKSLLARAFSIAENSSTCHHFFPLFILACEARTDEQRITILKVMDRNEGGIHIRSMRDLKSRILSMWVQQDLNADTDLVINYHSILDAVISSGYTFPSFT